MGELQRYYFDWAATAVPDTITASQEIPPFGNPSSKHTEGREASVALENARSRCAAVLGVSARHIYFTSGGTESNAIVLYSALFRYQRTPGKAVLVSAVEHPSVRENCAVLDHLGVAVATAGVEADGRVTRKTLEKAIDKYGKPRLAVIMAVNNETGAVNDIGEISRTIRAKEGAPVHIHSDMVQAAGKIPLDFSASDIDSASLSAHKIGGPRGIGLLYLRKDIEVLYSGGGQERNIRPGTENVAGAAALASCLERHAEKQIVQREYKAAADRMSHFIRFLKTIPRCTLLPQDRTENDERFSPYIVQFALDGIPGEVMVRSLDDAGFAVSTGSACSSSHSDRPVLTAMGIDEKIAFFGIRVSQGYSTTMDAVQKLCSAITRILAVL